MIDKLEAIQDKYYYLEEQLSDPAVMSDMDRYMKISKEYKDLEEVVQTYKTYKKVLSNIETSQEMLKDNDPEMQEMAKMELDELNPKKEELEEAIKQLMIPKDPEDEKDVIFEIRSGTGGDEASIFAGDLYRMYSKYFSTQGFNVEVISINEGTVGGYNKLVLEITGNNVYGKLKFESGAHRVQRIPQTESQGRVHTSAATVAVFPKLEMEDLDIKKSDLERQTFRASGAGGQHVNKTESGVRYIHLPTGIAAESTDGRSQHKNADIAMTRLYQKIYDVQKEAHDSSVAQKRKSLVGTGDRSGKVRTYNYPQNRVTDHRLEGDVKNFNLQYVIEGDIDGIIEALQVAENAEKMKAEVAED